MGKLIFFSARKQTLEGQPKTNKQPEEQARSNEIAISKQNCNTDPYLGNYIFESTISEVVFQTSFTNQTKRF